ncbi:MAG TPA: topoisomerase C-terminal repeat-containing protein, partial [Methylocella sp.]|nr:topoisomerase C-terminal repeat-containing protein [Methylocella sp.]
EAIALIAAKTSSAKSKGAPQGRVLGEHPSGGAVTVRTGRFGPYVNWGKINATLKSGMLPESITLEEAIRLLGEKESAKPKTGSGKTRAAARMAAKPEVSARKTAAEPSAPEMEEKKAKRASRA